MDKSDIVNRLNRKHGFRRYLEISTLETGRDFAKVDAARLDVKHRLAYRWPDHHSDGAPVTFSTPGPSSYHLVKELIAAGQPYDSIFVDPYHSYAYSLVDLSGAFALLRPGGVMVVHDCGPTDPEILCPHYKEGLWCGVTYAAFIDFTLGRRELSYYTVDCDFGCGVIYKLSSPMLHPAGDAWAQLSAAWGLACNDDDTRLQFYLENRTALLNLVSAEEFSRIL